jgi:DNA repair exonuclease SbcCD ATPase subunit
MRLSRIELAGFRGFAREESVDLNASAVVIVGVNGSGKTSLFDAVLWCLTGELRRLGDTASVVSLYSVSGEARVKLEIIDENETIAVTRSFDGSNNRLQVQIDGREYRGDAAKVRLLEALWPDALASADTASPLYTAMTRGVYLQQDLVREFLDADSEQDRFKAISELLGTGRVTDLQTQLDLARTAWSRATNQLSGDRSAAEARLAQLRADFEALTHVDDDAGRVQSRATEWLATVRDTGIETSSGTRVNGSDLAGAVRIAHRSLVAEWQRIDELSSSLKQLLGDLTVLPPGLPVVDAGLEAQMLEYSAKLAEAREALVEAERRAAQERERYVVQQDAARELAALANLALKHIESETCPVCGQAISSENVRARLHQMLEGAPALPPPDSTDLNNAAAAVRDLETRISSIEQALAAQRGDLAAFNRRVDVIRRRALDLGVVSQPDLVGSLQEGVKANESRLAWLLDLRGQGDALLVDLARLGEQSRRSELGAVIDQEEVEFKRLSREISLRETTGAIAVRILEALRAATSDIVARQLTDMGPLLQRIYGRIDPHPAFRVVRFISGERRGRGHMSTEVADPAMNLSSRLPSSVMSSSQTNALAVGIFLTLNLGLPKLPLDTAMLDDPLQSLDDVNLLGLIDLLRRTRARRQLIVSTHDKRFGQLLARKLRPVADGERTLVLELGDWGREGPSIDSKEVLRETRQYRVVTQTV